MPARGRLSGLPADFLRRACGASHRAGAEVARQSTSRAKRAGELPGCSAEKLVVCGKDDWFSPVASGSAAPKQMVVCPCSAGSVAAIAHGMSDNLIERAADVVLKERGQLILVVRETPFSTLHLENMHKLSQLGVTIMPAAPGSTINRNVLRTLSTLWSRVFLTILASSKV